jgi:hypothetical protein
MKTLLERATGRVVVPRAHRTVRLVLTAITAMLVLAACSGGDDPAVSAPPAQTAQDQAADASPQAEQAETDDDMAESGMGGDMEDMAADAPRIPPVLGYYGGEQVFFIHTEASDSQIAQTLEGMMGSPVPVVESLAEVPDDARSPVYVFTNGVTPTDTPAGPLGFQPDVFATAPGDEDYTPLRELLLVTWAEDAQPRVLTSAQEVTDAEAAGEVSVERPGVVVNIPLLTWPGGQR